MAGPAPATTPIPADQALAAAQADAVRVYRNLSPYRVSLVLEDDGWHVDYELKDPKRKGGGPHYLIDATTGAILSKRYEQ
jgi:Peptidase propeptide and YPEB domain